MKARINRAEISILVPVPDGIAEGVRAENEAVKALLKGYPHHAVTMIRVEDTPEYTAWFEALDFGPIRDELRRVAKKHDLPIPDGDFGVSCQLAPAGLVASVWVRRK